MIKKELLNNIKSFVICFSVLVLVFLFVYIIYPIVITEDTIKSMDDMMKMMPEEFLKAFNMDTTSISTPYGWVKSEGFVFVLLGVGIYASILGSNIVLKEEIDGTIEYLGYLPITRNKIMTNKIIVSLIYISGMIIGFMLFNLIALIISQDINIKEFMLLFFSPFLVAIPLFFINLFLSAIAKKNKKIIGLSLGLVFIFYFINLVSEISDKVEFLKYFSLYSLCDIRNIITNTKLSIWCILISVIISIGFCFISFIMYNKKELR